ncbi:hypothetical protein AGOR_G00046960 [Albula goreensis]|uniref:Mitochondrial ribosomal protein S36 n=1 Tax=Albula goreensis TaxID=1534307 RepID=A0A8T3DT09_9TELE|nr:hypothetical protein AGOR_G00046960 [Albula goreensis]
MTTKHSQLVASRSDIKVAICDTHYWYRNCTQQTSVLRKKTFEVAMGSKVSGKMAAAGRVVQVVRPHAPLIKFPNRKGMQRPNVQEVLKMAVASPPQPAPVIQSSAPPPAALAGRPPVTPATPATLTRLPGTPDTIASVRDLPQRYRRRLMAVEEMDFIQRGGPE